MITQALPLAARSPLPRLLPLSSAAQFLLSTFPRGLPHGRVFHKLWTGGYELSKGRRRHRAAAGVFVAQQRGYRKFRWRKNEKQQGVPKEKELVINVDIGIEEGLPDDAEILSIAEVLRLNASMAVKIAFDRLNDSDYKTRDTSMDNIDKFKRVELSILLCNDEFIRKLNKEWRDEDRATDVLSISEHIPGLKVSIMVLGDIVISVETAARQARERGHALLDEIRILMVHGLLHLLGFDHELSLEAEEEMEREEELILNSLGWKGKGLIKSANDSVANVAREEENINGAAVKYSKKEGNLQFYKPKFQYIFCDMDGTLLNSQCKVTFRTAEALREAISRGVKIVIATGKTRAAVIRALKAVDLAGKDGVVSKNSLGVFLQGLLVYGQHGQEVFRRNLEQDVCREAFIYSSEHKVPLVAFCQDRCLTLFDHPLVESLHTVYHEPKAEVISSVDHLVATADIQKLLFWDTAEEISTVVRPYWSEAIKDRANITQAQPDSLEIIPRGASKGNGVKLLLNHLDITSKEIMAIGDGENDIELLELASLGVALENGFEKTKSKADVIAASNDDDGVAEAIYRYAL